MTRRITIAAAALAALLAARPAEAKLFEVWASAGVGGVTGAGNQGDSDFFHWARGGAVNVEAGVSLWFIGAYIDYTRFFGGRAGANLVGFNLGGDGTINLTDNLALVLRAAGTFYVGGIDTPSGLTAEEDRALRSTRTMGVGARGGVGLRYTFFKVFSVGVTPQVGYHYFFKGEDTSILDTAGNSSGWDVQALGYFRFGLGI